MLVRPLTATAFGIACAFAAPLAAAPLPKDPPRAAGPHFSVQVEPIEQLVKDIARVVHRAGMWKAFPDFKDAPPASAEEGAKKLREGLNEVLGAGWEKALDPTKPWGGYVTLTPDPKDMHPILMLPTPDPKAFVKMVEGWGWMPQDAGGGRYRASFPFIFARVQIAFRFADGHAYITTDTSEGFAKEKLAPAADLMLKDESAIAAARFYIEGIPAELKKRAYEVLEEIGKVDRDRLGPQELLILVLVGTSDTKKFAERLRMTMDEGKWASLRLELDRKGDDLTLEFNLLAQKDTRLSKEIAGYVPKQGRMAGLLGKDAAVGFAQHYGTFGGLRAEVANFARNYRREFELNGIELKEEQIEPLVKAALDSLNVEQNDLAIALRGPSAKGLFGFVAGIHVKNGKKLEKEALAFLKLMPKELQARFKLNAEKLDGLEVHRVACNLPAPGDKPSKEVYGESDLYVIFRDDAVFAAFGENAAGALKEALALKPREAPAVLLELMPERFAALMNIGDPEATKRITELLKGKEKVRLLTGTVEGGPALRVRYTTDLIALLKLSGAARMFGGG